MAHPTQRGLTGFQFSRLTRDRGLPDPGCSGDDPDAAMPQRQCFRSYGQPTLTLVQMRQQLQELRRQNGLDPLQSPHTRPTSRAPQLEATPETRWRCESSSPHSVARDHRSIYEALVRIKAPCSFRSYLRPAFFSIFRATAESRSTPFICATAVR